MLLNQTHVNKDKYGDATIEDCVLSTAAKTGENVVISPLRPLPDGEEA